MRSYTPAALRYMAAVVTAAVVIAAYNLIARPWPATGDWIPFVILTVLAAVAHLYPVRSAREGAFYVVANVFVFAAVVMLPVPLLTLHALLAMLPYSLWNYRRPRVWYRWAFNTAQTVLAAQATRWLFTLFGVSAFAGPQSLVVILAAVFLFPLLQGFLVAQMLHDNNGVRILDAPPLERQALLSEINMALIGTTVAGLWHANPWLWALLPAPMVIIYSLMRRVQMIQLADIDPKTGLYNYRYFEDAFQHELARAQTVRRSVALLFMDLDYLRHINNRYGHVAGDYVLKELAHILNAQSRPGDLIARFGGEEFVAMLPGTDRQEALFLAEQVRRAVESHLYQFDGQPIRVTVSIGVVAFPEDGLEAAGLIQRADEVLYMAKADGRNCVKVASGQPALSPELRRPTLTALARGVEARPGGDARLHPPPTHAATGERETPPATPQPSITVAPPPAQPAPVTAVSLQPSWLVTAFPQVVAVIGGLALAWVLISAEWAYPQPARLGVMVLSAFLAELLTVQVYDGHRQRISISMGVGAILAAIGLLDLPAALLVGITGGLFHAVLTRRYEIDKLAFNLGNIALSTVAAATVYGLFPVARLGPVSLYHLLAPSVATLGFFAVNTGLLSAVIGLRTRKSPLAVWKGNLWFAPALILSGLTGAFLGATYDFTGLISAIVFLVPFLLMRALFSKYAQNVQQTIVALEKAKSQVEASHFEKEQTLDQLIVTVSAIIDARDRSVSGHSQQVARYGVAIGEELGLSPELVRQVRIAALLHDLGKIGIPESILNKPGRLSSEEYAVVQQHASLGYRIVSEVPTLGEVAKMVLEHHEHYSGKGYPAGKIGEDITIGARILSVADTLDTILSDRPYSTAKPVAWAIEELQRCAGEQFDPKVVNAVVRLAATHEHATFFVNSAQSVDEETHRLFHPDGARVLKLTAQPRPH